MQKDYWRWHTKKENIQYSKGTALFNEREVWWCAIGANIGNEQDGSPSVFTRPVVILKKFNLDSCLIVPLTGSKKEGRYYFYLGQVDGRDSTAILSQVRFIDRKRLTSKMATLDRDTFQGLVHSVVSACFPVF